MAPVLFMSEPFTYPGGGIASGVQVKVLYGGTEVPAAIFHDTLGTRKPNPVRTASDGTVEFYAEPGDYVLRANGTDTIVDVEGVLPDLAAYSYQLSVGAPGGTGTGVARVYNDTGRDQMVTSVRASAVDVASGGLTVDVNIDGLSIFVDPLDRPTLPVASGTGSTSVPVTGAELPAGSYLSVDVDAGTYNHLVVQVFVR